MFATARRKFQAGIRRLRESLVGESLSGYAVMFADVLPAAFLKRIDPTRRNRHFGHLPMFWAWLAQILEGNASCSKAIGFIQSWCRTQGLPAPSSDTGSYCRARLRLSDAFFDQVARRVGETLARGERDGDRWHGLSLKAVDGTTVKLADTEANQKSFPQPSVQKPGCGFPVMGIAGLVNLSHGGWEAMTTGAFNEHDLTLAEGLLDHIHSGDLLLGDRAYCSYAFIAAVLERGGQVVMRLHQQREVALDWRKGRKISPHERLVTWRRPAYSALKGRLSREAWEALPVTLGIRLIRLKYEDRSGRLRPMTVVTTLTDPAVHDGVEIHSLYARRWEIELRLRDIKTTLGFEMMHVKTPVMARKTLAMIQIADNLMRVLMQRAAHEAGEPVGSISFKGALDLTTSIHESFRNCAGKPRKRAGQAHFLVKMMATRLVDHRPFRREPRTVKRRPKPYPLLNTPRYAFVEIPHRSRYRKVA
ncbi:hypothetical protein HNR46_004270 [Haloferula luteola]|uniref:Transposase IS4-like domain-containing protein n=1 Tax=Haloferula luteola TaxID=595692 RepID=A0A840VHD5_9BACT|nr:hypothetical protein [Haloferula luteola]